MIITKTILPKTYQNILLENYISVVCHANSQKGRLFVFSYKKLVLYINIFILQLNVYFAPSMIYAYSLQLYPG